MSLHLTLETSLDVGMQGAIFRGIYNIQTTPHFTCTSNCTWRGPYISLGFASRCQNVTESTLATMSISKTSTGPLGSSVNWLNMTTPNGIPLSVKLYDSYRTQIQVAARRTNIIDTKAVVPWNLTFTGKKVMSPELVRVGVIRRRTDSRQAGYYEDIDQPGDYIKELEVFDCAVGFTAHNYTAVSASGSDITIHKETIELQPGTLEVSRLQPIRFTQDGLPEFLASTPDTVALTDLFLSSRFVGSMTSGQVYKDRPTGAVIALLKSNISEVFDNLAASMTEELRTHGDVSAEGVIIVNEVFVRIEWIWLILPIGVTLTAALFLLATYIDSKMKGCMPWKSSSLALLYHEVVERKHEQVVLRSDMRDLNEMEEAAKNTKAILE